ncbi:MAG: capsule biosynthesis protein CapA [Pseudomonadota bacterium]
MHTSGTRRFLFLQGPHGPFFGQLARRLQDLGHHCQRIGINQGDRAFWPRRLPYTAFRAPLGTWPETLAAHLTRHAITDLVVYSDARAFHRDAIAVARETGLRVHVFEEGYLRPYWISYERDGANGNSALMQITRDQIDAAAPTAQSPARRVPAVWGALRQHIFYGALYHFCVLALNHSYPAFRPHRSLGTAAELRLYLRLMAGLAPRRIERALAERRIARLAVPSHLVLLQLAHDASFRDHGPFETAAEFIRTVLQGFAEGAPPGHHLIFKTHPLEDGREPIARTIRTEAQALGLGGRVHVLHGGKLARLLDETLSVVTVNSTAAQQALWRGLPVKAFGEAVYCKPGFVSDQPLATFFAAPQAPDLPGYLRFREALLTSSQVQGSFYAAAGRRQLLKTLPDRMLDPAGPYQHIVSEAVQARYIVAGDGHRGKSAPTPSLKVVQ